MAGREPRSHTPWRAAIESVHQCNADVIKVVAIAMIARNYLLRQSTDRRTSGAIVRPTRITHAATPYGQNIDTVTMAVGYPDADVLFLRS